MLQTGANNRQKGYTLLEMLVTLGIISLMALAIPSLITGLWPGVQLKSAESQIKSDLVQMRVEARLTGQPAGLMIGENSDTYILLPSQEVRTLKPGIKVSLSPHPELFFQETEPEVQILFFPNGRSSGGILHINKDTSEALLQVDWLTSKIEKVS